MVISDTSHESKMSFTKRLDIKFLMFGMDNIIIDGYLLRDANLKFGYQKCDTEGAFDTRINLKNGETQKDFDTAGAKPPYTTACAAVEILIMQEGFQHMS